MKVIPGKSTHYLFIADAESQIVIVMVFIVAITCFGTVLSLDGIRQ
jgi:hypothetical protein